MELVLHTAGPAAQVQSRGGGIGVQASPWVSPRAPGGANQQISVTSDPGASSQVRLQAPLLRHTQETKEKSCEDKEGDPGQARVPATGVKVSD